MIFKPRRDKQTTLVKSEPKPRTKLYHQLNRIYQQILFFKLRSAITQVQKEKEAKKIEQKLLSIGQQETDDHNLQKVLNLCAKYASELVTCITDPNVSPDNNSAERALRPAVIARKISGSSRSNKGDLTHEVNLSVIETLRKQEKQLFPVMKELVLKYIASNA